MSTRLVGTGSDAVQRIGRYDLVAEIASGGMATVYLARLSGVGGFQRNVAIKCLHPHLARNLEFVEMFLDEARLAAGIHHPNVVPIQEVEESEHGYYLVMDYVEGDTFASLLSRSASLGRQMPLDIALRILIDTLTGLDAAHELRDDHARVVGLVHRDVSPQNILVGTDGVARITDFGVAHAASRLSATRAGQLKGKLAYMAPEQAGGEEEVDRRADVFSAGVVLWEALAFRRLFKASNEAATLTRVLTEAIVSPREINPALPESIARVCMKALERDLNRRYVSCAEFADALERAAVEASSLATTREVAAFVLEVVGDDVESHRRAIRQWLDRRERSQSGLAAAGNELLPAPTVRAGADGSQVTSPNRHSLVGRLPPPSFGIGSIRPPAEAPSDLSSSWPGTLPSMPMTPPPRRSAVDLPPPSVLGLPPPIPRSGPPPMPSAPGGSSPQGGGFGNDPNSGLVPSSGYGAFSPPYPGGQRTSEAAALLAMSSDSLAYGAGLAGSSPLGPPPPASSSAGLAAVAADGSSAFDAPRPEQPARRRGLMLAGVVAAVLLLSFGATWLATDETPAPSGNGTLPLRTNANGSGSAGAEPAKATVTKPENAAVGAASAVPPVAAVSAAPPTAASPAAPVVIAPARVESPAAVSPPPNRVVRTPVAPRKAKGSGPKGPSSDLENPYQ